MGTSWEEVNLELLRPSSVVSSISLTTLRFPKPHLYNIGE